VLRIGLINLVPSTDTANYLGYNHGLGMISAVLKADGHATRLFTMSRADDERAALKGFAPDAIFIYLATNQYQLFEALLSLNWRAMGVPVFVGGPHPTACPEETARLPGVFGACVGEGEMTALAIARRLKSGRTLDGVPNLWYCDGGALVKGHGGHYVEDLDTLPFPDRDIFPYPEMLRARAVRLMGLEFMATRGCVYGCRYCLNPLLRKVHGKGCVRRRSVTHLLDEMTEVVGRFGYTGVIGFHDDIFTLSTDWLERFAALYGERVGLPFWCNAHVAELTEDIIKTLRRAGCFRVHMGIECGNEEMRQTVLGKRISNREILDKVRLLKRHHMKIVTTFMMGLPDEDESHILESIALCRGIAPDWVLLSTFCPYPGTRLYSMLVEKDLLDPFFYKSLPSPTFYAANKPFAQGGISEEKLAYYFRSFRELAGVPG
jgi:radical SAM superfamily enzyme YgiQ (UPF0313 family)